jgi:hypothetical protein
MLVIPILTVRTFPADLTHFATKLDDFHLSFNRLVWYTSEVFGRYACIMGEQCIHLHHDRRRILIIDCIRYLT